MTKLVEITYYRDEDVNNIKNAVVTTMQARDIKSLIPWIHIIKINPSPKGKNRSYILE